MVAIKCLSTPANHVFSDGQVLLHLAKVRLVKRGGIGIEPRVQRQLNLRGVAPGSATGNETPSDPMRGSEPLDSSPGSVPEFYHSRMERLEEELRVQRQHIHQVHSAEQHLCTVFKYTIAQIQQEGQQLKHNSNMIRNHLDETSARVSTCKEETVALRGQLDELEENQDGNFAMVKGIKLQIDAATGAVSSLKSDLMNLSSSKASCTQVVATNADLKNLKKELSNLKTEVNHLKKDATETLSAVREYGKEVATLKDELGQVQGELGRERTTLKGSKTPVVPNQEIEILANSISRISNRANKVETLEMELELVKRRICRLESGAPESQDPKTTASPSMSAFHKRRASTETPHCANTASKRLATSSSIREQSDSSSNQQASLVLQQDQPQKGSSIPPSQTQPGSSAARTLRRRPSRKLQVAKTPFEQD